MLKIERVDIDGFKSFCDRTEVRFTNGITAVVGPNGCGKSNIGDAIHWVLGVQSPRTLRSGKMEDVIFAGTESRGPHGMAEVSLHFQASNGDLPGGDPSATVTRRLFRSGDSEYYINGRKVRLRDIQDMLHAARVGAATYAVIEQGKVDAILSAKPRERRFLIEEAAGIIGYKQKRRLAELKLEATQANLLRIHDVVLEVRRQINSLKRQAARARRYSRVRDELRGVEGRLLAARARLTEAESARLRAALAESQAREAESAASLGRSESELEALHQSRREVERAASAKREAVHGLAREIDREESSIKAETEKAEQFRREAADLAAESGQSALRLAEVGTETAGRAETLAKIDAEIAEIERSAQALDSEEADLRARSEGFSRAIESRRADQFAGATSLAELANTIVHLRKESDRLSARSARLGLDLGEAKREAASLEDRAAAARASEAEATVGSEAARCLVEETRAEFRSAEEKVRELLEIVAERRETVARTEERVRSLEDVEGRLAGIGAGARWLLTRNGGGSIRGLLADFLRVGAESEGAVEGYLGPLLAAVVVPSSESAVAFAEELSENRAGRCLFVPEGEPGSRPTERPLPPGLAAEPGVLGPLSDRASTTNGIGGLLAARLQGAVLARDLRSAVALSRRHPGLDFVTPSGEVVGRDGTIEGGRGGGSEDGLLARRRLLETARAARESAAAALGAGDEERHGAETDLVARAGKLDASEHVLREAETSAALAHERADGLASECERAAKRVTLLHDEILSIEDEARELLTRIEGTEATKGGLEEGLGRLVGTIDADRAAMERLMAEAALRAEQLAERRQARAAARERRTHTAAELSRLEADRSALAERRDRSISRCAEAERRAGAAEGVALLARDRLARGLVRHGAATAELAETEERIRGFEALERDLETRAREARAELDDLREQRRGAEVAAAGTESEWRHLGEKCRELLDEELGSLLARVPDEPAIELPALEAEAANLGSRLEAMGPVNLLAIDEFRELEERHGFLLGQEKDLNDSMESLKETIRRINRTSRELFVEAFERIREAFNETFKILFGGGRADIKLMEDEDPLECGLEIIVQPPGKRLQSLSLLSGGEKALSAIALLFAIFRYQPSPFCLLDEVDAALDETNVRRFTRMLQEFCRETQFIVITHNKRSMEAANTLYGVTMEEPGVSRIVSMSLS